MAEKNRDPTPRRLRDARRQGEVVFSPDISSTAVFVAVVALVWLAGATAFGALQALWHFATEPLMFAAPDQRMAELMTQVASTLLWLVIPVAAIAALAGILGSFSQVGGLAVWSRIKPDAKRLNPAQGLQRIFSTRNLVNLGKMLAKTLLLGALLFVVIRGFLGAALKLGYSYPGTILSATGRAVLVTFAWAGVIYAVMAAVDYAHQRFEFMKKHRMSIDDLRRENKETEGDPIVAGRRKAAHFEAVYMNLGDRVRASSAVIRSQRVAVALQYLGDKDLPRVIARGEGQAALQITRFASEALIPVEEDAGLAERLYDEVPIDQPIHRSLYAPVATLLRWAQGQ
jgi:type III secretion protein U